MKKVTVIVLLIASLINSSLLTSTIQATGELSYIWPNIEFSLDPNRSSNISWISSNGRYIALETDDWTGRNPSSWLLDRATDQASKLNNDSNDWPQLSDDARYMLYSRHVGPGATQWLRDRTTGSDIPLGPSPSDIVNYGSSTYNVAGQRTLSKDGSVAIFTSGNFQHIPNQSPYTNFLYAYERETGNYTLINDPSIGKVASAALSGNGRYVLYTQDSLNNSSPVFRYDRETNTRQSFGPAFNCAQNSMRINSDGSVFAYSCQGDSAMVNLNTGEVRNGNNYGSSVITSMSDDGSIFVFSNSTIYSWQSQKRLPINPSQEITGQPQISGDGSKIAGLIRREPNPPNIPYTSYSPVILDTPKFDISPPTITPHLSQSPNSEGWNNTPITLNWDVNDLESQVTEKIGCDQIVINSSSTQTCTATSAGGTATFSINIKIDMQSPAILASKSLPTNSKNWNNSNVTISFSCSDVQSGIASCSAPLTLSNDGANQSSTGTAVDNAGNTSSTTVSGINIDKTAPTTTSASISGWLAIHWANPTITANTSDNLSGVTSGEYYIDTDPGQGNGKPMTYDPSTGKLKTSLVISGGSNGYHTIYIRSKDAAGNWSTPTSVRYFYIA